MVIFYFSKLIISTLIYWVLVSDKKMLSGEEEYPSRQVWGGDVSYDS